MCVIFVDIFYIPKVVALGWNKKREFYGCGLINLETGVNITHVNEVRRSLICDWVKLISIVFLGCKYYNGNFADNIRYVHCDKPGAHCCHR